MPEPSPCQESPPSAPSPGLFPATAWTLVQRALGGAEAADAAALNKLFELYWQPIYIYLRRTGRSPADAEDLTQSFFVHLLEKQLLERVRLRQVRFRAFLRSVLEHFLANEARTATAQKRQTGLRMDLATAEGWLAARPQESPESAFDGIWAVERLERAFARLRQELQTAGREWVADALVQRAGMAGAAAPLSLQEFSQRHGVNANQLSVALHRARQRLRELIVDEIRDSVTSAEDAADELNALFTALRHRP